MQIVKCDFCGAEVENPYYNWGKDKLPKDLGWAYIKAWDDTNSSTRRDMCPRCIPKERKK